jgi:polyisoprenyl-teichoic acid--peptidoglycan teichoic acid transferase
LKKTRRRERSKSSRWRRARYRRRRLLAVLVLACLLFGTGTQAAAFFEAQGAGPGGTAETTGSPGFVPTAFEGLLAQGDSSTISAGETRSPAHKSTKDLASSRSRKPTTEAKDQSARKAAPDARLEASKEARQEASKDAEEASSEPLDVLVLGVDRRPSSAEGASTRSDTMMLVRVIPATGEVKLLSVPRDLYVEVKPGEKDRINTAYAYGGVDQARAVMEDLTGVDIDNYAIEHWNMGEGFERLNGYKALKYARYRGTPGADLDRIDHQQKLLAALRRQALRWDTVTKIPGIIKVANENVNTDLGVLQVIPLTRALVINGEDNKMTTAALEGHPTSLSDGEQVLTPDEEANEAILQDFRQ